MNRDGDLDALIITNGAEPLLLRNDLPGENAKWLRIRLRGRAPNLDAIGALVTVYSGDLVQARMVRTGSSYLTQSETTPLVFGLGDRVRVDSVTVRWPTSGLIDRIGPLDAHRGYIIHENGDVVIEEVGR